MKDSRLSARFWPILLILTGLAVLGEKVSQLRLYLDDNVWIFPSLLKEEFKHFAGYTYNFGLYRPLSDLTYYLFFDIYVKSPSLAHLLGLVLQINASILVYLILKRQKVDKILTYLISLLVLFLPFATESYMWLSGIPSLFAIILFLLQIIIVLNQGLSKKTFLLVLFIQLIGIFNYESTFFFFIPFIYLFLKKIKTTKFSKKILSVLLVLPNFLWLVSKIIWPGHTIETRFKLIGLSLIPERIFLSLANSFNLFFSPSAINLYWKENFINGLSLISPLAYVFLALAGLIIFLCLIFDKKESFDGLEPDTPAVFWFLCFIASLLPNILINNTSFSFRTIYLPVICLLVFIPSFLKNISGKMPEFFNVLIKGVVSVSFLIFLILSVPGDLAIAKSYTVNWYRELSVRDQIRDEIDRVTAPDNKINVYLVDYPVNLADSVKYMQGEWLLSCFNLTWCGKNMMAMVTDKIDTIETVTEGKDYLSKMQKPFVVFKYELNDYVPLLKIQSITIN